VLGLRRALELEPSPGETGERRLQAG
jgi:hypothetical protein